MPIRLLYTYNYVISTTMTVFCLSDSMVNSFASIVAMADDFPFLIYHVPTVQSIVMIDMKSVF